MVDSSANASDAPGPPSKRTRSSQQPTGESEGPPRGDLAMVNSSASASDAPGPPSKRTRSSQPPRCEALQFKQVHCKASAYNQDGSLKADVLHKVVHALHHGNALLIKRCLLPREREQILKSWTKFVDDNASTEYQTPDWTAAKKSLGHVWKHQGRIETGLRNDPANPLADWLHTASKDQLAVQKTCALFEQLKTIANGHAQWLGIKEEDVETKAFIAGHIEPGGGPCHYDAYDNLALGLTGKKVFYHAEHAAFSNVIMRGEFNERLGINPFNDVKLNKTATGALLHENDECDLNGDPLVDRWAAAVLEPGDVLCLPHHWWHWVWSEPQTTMINLWIQRTL